MNQLTKAEKRYVIAWAVAWVLWLAIQHVTWVLNFGATAMSLSNANAVCSLAQQMNGGYISPMCNTVATWWGFTTFLFWAGLVALAGLGITVYRTRARRQTGEGGADPWAR